MKVAIEFPFPAHAQVAFFTGLEAASRHLGADWDFVFVDHSPESIARDQRLLARIDACVGCFVSDRWLAGSDFPDKIWINLAQWTHSKRVANVGFDYRELGRRAGGFFLRSNVGEIVVMASPSQVRGHDLFAGMSEAVRGRFLGPVSFGPRLDRREIRAWLNSLTNRVGLLTVNDQVARQVIEEARDLSIRVGDDLQIVGIGCDPESSLLAGIGIASFPLPFFEAGQAVVGAIYAEMRKANRRSIYLPPGELVLRPSAMPESQTDPVIQQAKGYMLKHLSTSLGIDDLAKAAGVSRRTLETRFRASGLSAPASAWNDIRMDEARRLLARTDLMMHEIAERCGFASQQRFAQIFRRLMACNPSEYRSREKNAHLTPNTKRAGT